jgi:DNA ligase 1
MRAFAQLLDGLVYTQSRNRKVALLATYFRTAPDPDRGWALAALTDGVPLPSMPLRRMLTELTSTFIDPVLYKLSRDYVGDTAETVSLLWPDTRTTAGSPSLDHVVQRMNHGTTPERTAALGSLLNQLDASGRFALIKLLGGAPRVGVSARLAKTALADAFGHEVNEIEELWHALSPPYIDLFGWLTGKAVKPDPGSKPVFKPVMLAHPIEDDDWPKLQATDFVAEWKWDGIRIQVAARGGEVRLFSRQGDDISAAFPDVQAAFLMRDGIVDGELLVIRQGLIAPFNDLQQRLNRKTVTAKMQRDFPAHVRLYDLLDDGCADLRALPFTERRQRLEAWHQRHRPPLSDLSSLVAFNSFDDLNRIWANTRAAGIEGLMLKRRDSAYQPGRVRGEWFKWKRAALTLDCVLMYAQRGSGRRSSFYSDYTFGVWRTAADGSTDLVPVGKAYSGFTDDELRRLDKWVRDHTTSSFGPVRAVEPGLVLEIAFDAVHASARHKSGVAMRFPRVHRLRWDKPAADADTLETITALVGRG